MFKVILVLVGILLLPVPASAAKTPRASASTIQIQAFVKAYADAMNKANVAGMMAMISHKRGVTSVGEGDIDRGWEAIRVGTNEMIGQAGSHKITIGPIEVLSLTPSIAVVVAPIAYAASIEQGGEQSQGALSLVLEKSAGKWLIVHEHESMRAQEEGD